jgi:hypothetical protein
LKSDDQVQFQKDIEGNHSVEDIVKLNLEKINSLSKVYLFQTGIDNIFNKIIALNIFLKLILIINRPGVSGKGKFPQVLNSFLRITIKVSGE